MALSEKPVVCTECNASFTTVRESIGHEHMKSGARVSPTAVTIEYGLSRNSLRSLCFAFRVFTMYPHAARRRDLVKLLTLPPVS